MEGGGGGRLERKEGEITGTWGGKAGRRKVNIHGNRMRVSPGKLTGRGWGEKSGEQRQ